MQNFHPLIQNWFKQKFGQPTVVQHKAWTFIKKGNHVLISAPTGSGKTMAAFLWSINQLITGVWETGSIRVLYISPLKALNNDIQRNLLEPLKELDHYFTKSGRGKKVIRVGVRSGDTPANERRHMLRNPPEILITTPETLNNLLTSKNGRSLLTGLTTVVLDEIHAVFGNKRGTHLITAVERLVGLSGEFQRITLSATVKPLKRVAAFVGGFNLSGTGKEAFYESRPVKIVNVTSEKVYDIRVDFPAEAKAQISHNSWWPLLIEHFKKSLNHTNASLFFANSRRLTEKITGLLNENEEEVMAYAHHGALSKELRLAVEKKLKDGMLKSIVATSSLELGIDVGTLDMVGLVQTPMSVSSAVQRVGRAGHGVGEISHGIIYPTFGLDFVCAAAMAKAITEKDVEEILPIEAPLDVLTQTILSMTCHSERHIDDLFTLIKTSYPYRNLARKQFDLVIAMLEGRYADIRIKELSPRISFDRLTGLVKAKKGTDFLLYMAGGTITDRGYFNLRLEDAGLKIGELDEEFVWERTVGDVFALGSQMWRVQRITHNDVFVSPGSDKWDIIPFWKAEHLNRDTHFSRKVADFLENGDLRLHDESFIDELVQNYCMTPAAAKHLIDFLKLQKEKTGTCLPHRHHILVEHVNSSSDRTAGRTDARQVILHTLWGGRLNRPFALALSTAWENEQASPLQIFADNDGIVLMLPSGFNTPRLFEMVTPENLEVLLTQKLEQTGFFGALFRENAGRALLLPKQHFKKRMPLWLNRLRSKKLLKSVQAFNNFPILLETFRTCLQDEFDLINLKLRLAEIRQKEIRISETFCNIASPFASSLVFRQTDMYMYSDDTPLSADGTSLKKEYIRDLMAASHLRPRLPETLLSTFQKKVQRIQPGYAPQTDKELLDWLKERLMIPINEWEALLSMMEISLKNSPLLPQIVSLTWSACGPFITHLEVLPKFCKAFSVTLDECILYPAFYDENKKSKSKSDIFRDTFQKKIFKMYALSFEEEEIHDLTLEIFIGQWLSFYGPLPKRTLQKIWGLSDIVMDRVVRQLAETDQIMIDIFSATGQEEEVCDSQNLERLLFLYRQSLRPAALTPLLLTDLPHFIARLQGVGQKSEDINELKKNLERLFGLSLSAQFWEEFVWPCRFGKYHTSWLDKLMQISDLAWFGCGEKKLSFAFLQDLELFIEPAKDQNITPLPSTTGKFSFFDVLNYNRQSPLQTSQKLWEKCWRGIISNDTFEVVRKGIYNRFKLEKVATLGYNPQKRSGRTNRRVAFNRWKRTRPLTGNWYALPKIEESGPIETSEIIRDRVRQLLRRYGVLFRQLLSRELPILHWSKIFNALRLMEFSGEVLCGHFFSGINGLQFASKEAFMRLQNYTPNNKVFWINAQDPASLCGVDLPELKNHLPRRLATTFLVYQGSRLILVVKRNGKELEFKVEPDFSHLKECLQLFKDLLGRDFNPLKNIVIKKVNNENVLESPFFEPLKTFGFKICFDGLELWRKI
jgi:ATP-dependent Lhr-like helicase